jgi:hypothetical protein
MLVAEMIGLALVGYGIWFGARGIGMQFTNQRDWWRPTNRKSRYPYPASGILLGICFAVLGARFALHNVLPGAEIIGYVGGGLFILVVAVGVGQPRFLHPRWYGMLEDRLGKKGVAQLTAAARKMDTEEWIEVSETEATFDAWVRRTAIQQPRSGRGYKK